MPALAAKIALGLVSVLVMSLTGYAWAAMQGLVDGLVVADVISDGAGGDLPADGSRDILLVGLDSRTDARGNPLTKEQLQQLRAGRDDGELNTDTLILVHIPNDGSKAVAISMPRDSYVDVPGFGTHKINSAYARGKAVERQRLENEGTSDERSLEVRSNEAGAKTLIATVEQLTGRTIDNFASVNLFGFYEITQAIGGVDVCLKNPVNDVKSHSYFDAGFQTISGRDALAFVRQRFGLPRGDLDRVVRQQVFMAGMARRILSAGTLANPGKLNELMGAITNSVVLDQGWDVLGFAQQMSGLTGGQIEFHTIPIRGIDRRTEAGSVVDVDPNEVREFIADLSGEDDGDSMDDAESATDDDSASNAEVTVNVMNTTPTPGLAATAAQTLTDKGFVEGTVDNAPPRGPSMVLHAPGEEDSARRVADALGEGIAVQPDAGQLSGEVTVLLGTDYTPPADATADSDPTQEQAQAPVPGQDPAQQQADATEPDPELNNAEPITAEGVTCVN